MFANCRSLHEQFTMNRSLFTITTAVRAALVAKSTRFSLYGRPPLAGRTLPQRSGTAGLPPHLRRRAQATPNCSPILRAFSRCPKRLPHQAASLPPDSAVFCVEGVTAVPDWYYVETAVSTLTIHNPNAPFVCYSNSLSSFAVLHQFTIGNEMGMARTLALGPKSRRLARSRVRIPRRAVC